MRAAPARHAAVGWTAAYGRFVLDRGPGFVRCAPTGGDDCGGDALVKARTAQRLGQCLVLRPASPGTSPARRQPPHGHAGLAREDGSAGARNSGLRTAWRVGKEVGNPVESGRSSAGFGRLGSAKCGHLRPITDSSHLAQSRPSAPATATVDNTCHAATARVGESEPRRIGCRCPILAPASLEQHHE